MAPSRFFTQLCLPGAGKQALIAAGPQPVVFQIYRFNLIRRHQIGPVRADKAVSQLNFQLIETSYKINLAAGGMKQNMVGDGGGFKKDNIAQGDMSHRFSCPQSEQLRGVLALVQQSHMYLA